jgi:carbon monoxide dehydrogenase subunit G
MSKRIESQKIIITCLPEKVFNFLGDFHNFTSLLPEHVDNWQSAGDSCSFEIKGLTTVGLRITGTTPFSKISMKSEGKLPFNFTFDTFIEDTAPQQCQVQLIIESDMNPYIAMMAAKPLQNCVDMLLPKLKEEMEK